MKGRLNVQKCTLCVCVLTLILVCVLLYQRNVTEGFQNKQLTEEEEAYDKYIKDKIGKGEKKGKRDGRGQGKYGGKHKFDDGQVKKEKVKFSDEEEKGKPTLYKKQFFEKVKGKEGKDKGMFQKSTF